MTPNTETPRPAKADVAKSMQKAAHRIVGDLRLMLVIGTATKLDGIDDIISEVEAVLAEARKAAGMKVPA